MTEAQPRRRSKPTSKPAPAPRDQRLFVRSVEKTFAVLRVFGSERESLSLGAIAAATGLGKSAVQRFVYSLHALGYLRQNPTTRHYSLSPRLLELSAAYLRADSLVERAQPFLAEANRTSEETVNLNELIDTDVVVVSRFASRHVVSVNAVIGQKYPAFCSAAGRAILAYLPEPVALYIIDRSERRAFTRHTVTDRDALRAILSETRSRGYSIADQQLFIGDISMAAPVFDGGGAVIAAVNIAGAASRWSVDGMRRRIAPILVETARAITTAIAMR
jgi:DNA-binding IclR family transcriptional regulator